MVVLEAGGWRLEAREFGGDDRVKTGGRRKI
jgi:hypothetical protein